MDTKTCKECGEEKPYDPNEKQNSKASGFYGCQCWDCYRLSKKLQHREIRSTPEGRARRNATNAKSQSKRLKLDTHHRLRCSLATETNQLVRALAKGGGTDAACQKIFRASRWEVICTISEQLDARGFQWQDYQTHWTCDHKTPVGLAQNDVELRSLFELHNLQVLTHVEHKQKTVLDTALVRAAQV